MGTAQRKPPEQMTAKQFQAWAGDGIGGRYQLIDGEVRAMSPASTTHGTIQGELYRLIGNHLKASRSKCRALVEPAVEVRIRSDVNLRVPDIGVTCIPDKPKQVAMPDPLLLIEILSATNVSDTWKNVWAYTTIPGLKEILIVHSTRIAAEHLLRQPDGSWPETTTKLGARGALDLSSIGFKARLKAVYDGTHLA